MTPVRVAAAAAAILTALLFQATLIGPLTVPVAVSLPAVLVAAVALVDGPATGMSFGFAAGLIADLASSHPAGVLALWWLGVGVVCGSGATAADGRSIRDDAATAAVVCALAGLGSALLLTAVHAPGATAWAAVRDVIPVGLGDALLALPVVPLVRAFLRTNALRAPHPVAELRIREY
jgi:hypothetical protein